MLRRKAYEKLLDAAKQKNAGIFVDGARQVGKTYILKKLQEECFTNNFYVNVLTDIDAFNLLRKSTSAPDFYLRLSYLFPKIVNENSSIFIDEIQVFYDKDNPNKDIEDEKIFDIITLSKQLVIDYPNKFIFSGSLLGFVANNVVSWPIGYVYTLRMYPLDFEEFCWALNKNESIFAMLKESFKSKTPVADFINDEYLQLFNEYCLIGGMPEAVKAYAENNNLKYVEMAHSKIEDFIKHDIATYAPMNQKIHIKEIYSLIPSELNSKNKRFQLKKIESSFRGEDMTTPFEWIKTAGVAIPVYNVTEPKIPLILSSKRSLLKVFHEDVGLLTYLMFNDITKFELLKNELKVNYGAIYENAVAELLTTHGFEYIYYYNSKKYGEVDFVIEKNADVYCLEIKSGKDYKVHRALNNITSIKDYDIKHSFVFGNTNVKRDEEKNIWYLPIYMVDFINSK